MRTIILCFFMTLWAPAVFAQSYAPPDIVPLHSELHAFLQEVRDAVTQTDSDYLLSIVHPDCVVSYGGFRGKEDFKEYWFGGTASHGRDIFSELEHALALGGRLLESGSVFEVPYTASAPAWNEKGVMLGVILKPAINMRASPGYQGRKLGILGHELVRLCNIVVPIPVDGMQWSCVLRGDGVRGYVASKFLALPTDPRFLFRRAGGRWLLVSTVVGE